MGKNSFKVYRVFPDTDLDEHGYQQLPLRITTEDTFEKAFKVYKVIKDNFPDWYLVFTFVDGNKYVHYLKDDLKTHDEEQYIVSSFKEN